MVSLFAAVPPLVSLLSASQGGDHNTTNAFRDALMMTGFALVALLIAALLSPLVWQRTRYLALGGVAIGLFFVPLLLGAQMFRRASPGIQLVEAFWAVWLAQLIVMFLLAVHSSPAGNRPTAVGSRVSIRRLALFGAFNILNLAIGPVAPYLFNVIHNPPNIARYLWVPPVCGGIGVSALIAISLLVFGLLERDVWPVLPRLALGCGALALILAIDGLWTTAPFWKPQNDLNLRLSFAACAVALLLEVGILALDLAWTRESGPVMAMTTPGADAVAVGSGHTASAVPTDYTPPPTLGPPPDALA
jgi:hypothetical protein